MMKKETYGCPCCGPTFGKLFKSNAKVNKLSSLNSDEIAFTLQESDDNQSINRREFLKNSTLTSQYST